MPTLGRSAVPTPRGLPERRRSEQSTAVDMEGTRPDSATHGQIGPPATMTESKPEQTSNSPRTKVAQRLGTLDLRGQGEAMSERSLSPRKRIKLQLDAPDHESLPNAGFRDRPGRDTRQPFVLSNQSETPVAPIQDSLDFDFSIQSDISPPPSPTPTPAPTPRTASVELNDGASLKKSPKRLRSPPLPDDRSSHPAHTLVASGDASRQASIDLTALTWQESEITGHDIDPAFPEDDGLGINGVGFRPTPQMAYARKQKRRQQVSEWKAREAREARQKRLARRQGCQTGGENGSGARSVRFAVPG